MTPANNGRRRKGFGGFYFLWVCAVLVGAYPYALGAEPPAIELLVDSSHPQGSIDLTRYALGQGGFSDQPMIDGVIPQITQLHPQTIRLFVMEYFNIYPRHNEYYYATFDKAVRAILATGAKPILAICLKPKVLFPKVDQKIVFPSSWEEWESLLTHLVKHCTDDHLDIGYWEVANEPNIGEGGGGPYLFEPQDYVTYYTHTVNAIRRADAHAKVGGPTLATWANGPLLGEDNPILEALLDYCGKGKAPLDFVSWHLYESDPQLFRKEIREVRVMLAKYETLRNVETILDEWNMSLGNPVMNPYFQPAFVVETTYGFNEEGLSRSGYYHIRDMLFDPKQFAFLSRPVVASTNHFFNEMPIYLGLYDTEGRVRPTYYALKMLSLMKGERLMVEGTGAEVKSLAARHQGLEHVVFWNFPQGEGKTYDVTVRLPHEKTGNFQLIRLDPDSAINNLKILRSESVGKLDQDPIHVTLHPYEIYWVELGQ
jgi:hypothetical protein